VGRLVLLRRTLLSPFAFPASPTITLCPSTSPTLLQPSNRKAEAGESGGEWVGVEVVGDGGNSSVSGYLKRLDELLDL
jgi:hypothetical protein